MHRLYEKSVSKSKHLDRIRIKNYLLQQKQDYFNCNLKKKYTIFNYHSKINFNNYPHHHLSNIQKSYNPWSDQFSSQSTCTDPSNSPGSPRHKFFHLRLPLFDKNVLDHPFRLLDSAQNSQKTPHSSRI